MTRKGVVFAWTDVQQTAFDTLKACLLNVPILGFPMEEDRFILDTDASFFAVGGVLNQLQNDREVVIAYASQSLRLSQRRYYSSGNGDGGHVYSFSFIIKGSPVHFAHGS